MLNPILFTERAVRDLVLNLSIALSLQPYRNFICCIYCR